MARRASVIRGYPDDALLEELRRAAEFVGKPALTKDDFTRLAGISADAIAHRFGNWKSALERAGLSHLYSGERKLSDDSLLDELRRVARIVDGPVLTENDFKERAEINPFTVARRFGGWGAALERAGLGHLYSEPGCRNVWGQTAQI